MNTAENLDRVGVKSDPERRRILAALDTLARSRPGLQFANYGNLASYRRELAGITRDLQQARVLLAAVMARDIGGEALKRAMRDAYSGRLSWNGESLDYCTGQYYPTEYRRAICAVLATALWSYWRDDCSMKGDAIRKQARKEFGRGIGARWFD